MSSTKRFASLQDDHELYSDRIGNAVYKIYGAKKQDHLGTHQAIQRVRVELVATSWVTESLAYHFQQRNSKMQNVRTRSRKADRKVREAPAQGILPSGLEPDAEDQRVQRRIAGTDRRHEQHRDLRTLRKILPNNNVLSAIPTGILGHYFPAEQLRRHLNPWLRKKQSRFQTRTF